MADAGLDALDGLTSLVEKSLLVRSELRGEARFHMLETVREFARERVAEAGEERAARLRHCEWVVQFLADEHDNLMNTTTRQAAHERVAAEAMGARLALRFAAGADGDPELAWQLFIRFGAALISSFAQTAEVLAMHDDLDRLPRPADSRVAALALGVWSWARASMFDARAAADLEAACAVLEADGDREFLMSFQTAWGMLIAPTSLPRALELLDRAVALSRDAGQTIIEGYALMTICFAHLYGGNVDAAEHAADEFTTIARQRHDDEAMAYALTADARVKLMRGDLAAARIQFADAVAMASARSAAWARAIALCGLASATFAGGDEEAARAILEEALLFCVGSGYLGIDSLCGALALLLLKSGARDRAARVFDAVAAAAENEADFSATSTDPSGALRAATREARVLLGDPPPRDAPTVDLDAVLRAAVGNARQPS